MKNRPEYVNCVADQDARNKGKSWCGRSISFEWSFVDIDHAAENGRNRGRLVPCPDCVRAIVKALKEGQ